MGQIHETELDLSALIGALWRRSGLIVFVAALALMGTYALLSQVTPIYTADARILIEAEESPLTRPRETTPETVTYQLDASAIESQVEVLRSREIAGTVIEEFDLVEKRRLIGVDGKSVLGSLLAMVGIGRESEEHLRNKVLDAYDERLIVYPVGQSRVIAVEFGSAAPQLSADVANGVAEAFVSIQQAVKRGRASSATVWLEAEIERLRNRVAEAEAAVEDYRSGADLFEVNEQDRSLSTQQLGDLNAELARAKAARSEAEARAQLIRMLLTEHGSVEASQEVLGSGLIQRLQERQVALRAEIAELSTSLLPGHPRIQALEMQLANLSGQIRQEAGKILQSLETAARVARAREESLQRSLDEAKAAVSRSNEKGIELRALEREANAQRDLLETFLVRYREAIARSEASYLPADARIISRAVPPRKPSYPKKGTMSVAASAGFVTLTVCVLLLVEFTSGRAFRLIEPGPVDRPPGQRSALAVSPGRDRAWAGVVPFAAGPGSGMRSEAVAPNPSDARATEPPARFPWEDDEPAAPPAHPDSQPARSMPPGTQALAANLDDENLRVVLIAGARGGEDAGEIALATAHAVAGPERRCIVIDIGLEPSPFLSAGHRPGLGELLAGSAAFGEVIIRDHVTHVDRIAVGGAEHNPPLQRLALIIGALSNSYAKVLIVADRLSDWPDDVVHPHLAVIVCGGDLDQEARGEAFQDALDRGAASALIARRGSAARQPSTAPEAA